MAIDPKLTVSPWVVDSMEELQRIAQEQRARIVELELKVENLETKVKDLETARIAVHSGEVSTT